MGSQSIIVYIEEEQLIAQKKNNYSLYLAKKVNTSFTVIWISKVPLSTTGQPTYQYKNTFDIVSDSYMVNFTNTPWHEGDINFTSGGKNLPINIGQTTTLDIYGVFSPAQNGGVTGDVLINNQLLAEPRAILLDSTGCSLWVSASGMGTSPMTMTPKNEFQLWFGSAQAAGSLIPYSVSNARVANASSSNAYVVTVNDGETQTVTYTNSGTWVPRAPAVSLSTGAVMALQARVDQAVIRPH